MQMTESLQHAALRDEASPGKILFRVFTDFNPLQHAALQDEASPGKIL
jgi:hypothetical protein